MQIEIKLFASLRKYLPEELNSAALRLDVPEETTVAQVLEKLQVPLEETKLIFINSVQASLDQLLQADDRLGVFPAVAGG